ncbi:MAG: hypothetical protein L6R40_003324 [Gallowayella cf. fulva]|nr:MAG: hypothetical protein L6R40_003324 [Xanthomendoza cf. fulva]
MAAWNDFDDFIQDGFQDTFHDTFMHDLEDSVSESHAWSIPPSGGGPPVAENVDSTTDPSFDEMFIPDELWSLSEHQGEVDIQCDGQEQGASHMSDPPENPEEFPQKMKKAFESQDHEEVLLPLPEQQSTIGPYNSMTTSGYLPGLSDYISRTVPTKTQGNTDVLLDMTENSSEYQSQRYLKRVKKKIKGADRKLGEVVNINGVLRISIDNHLYPAVYHHEIRAQIIDKAPPDLYTFEPERGVDDLDVTSFWEPHRNWGFGNREDRPKILQEWIPKPTDRQIPGFWKDDDGRIILSSGGNPIRDWPIPSCISSQVEGGRCEAMIRECSLRDSRRTISNMALIERMLWHLDSEGNWQPPVTEGAVAMRRQRFRTTAGVPSPNPRQGSNLRKLALARVIPEHILIQILVTGTTECWRDLTSQELAYIESSTRGIHPEKAGRRAVTPRERRAAAQTKDRYLADFEPVNPAAEPYGTDDDDRRATDRARHLRGLKPLGHPQNDLSNQVIREHPPGNLAPDSQHNSMSSGTLEGLETSKDQSSDARQEVHETWRKRRRSEESGHSEAPTVIWKKRRHVVQCSQTVEGREIDMMEVSLGEMAAASPFQGNDTPDAFESFHPTKPPQLAPEASHNTTRLFGPTQPRRPPVAAYFMRPGVMAVSTKTATTPKNASSPDYRFLAPPNEEAAETIAKFIQYTESDVIRQLGIQPPRWQMRSYMETWELLDAWFVQNWPPGTDAPRLWRYEAPWSSWPKDLYWRPSTDSVSPPEPLMTAFNSPAQPYDVAR